MNEIDFKKATKWKLSKSTRKILHCSHSPVNTLELSVKECGHKMECDTVPWGGPLRELRETETDPGVDLSQTEWPW